MITIEQLMAKGLSENEAKMYLETLKEKDVNTKIPFCIAKIFYSIEKPEYVGKLVGGVEKNEKGDIINIKYDFGNKPQIRILKTMGQYTKFEYGGNESRLIVCSNIFPIKHAKKAIDLKSGKLISELKNEIPDIKYQMISLIVAKDINTNEWIPCIMYMRKSFLYEFNQNVKFKDYINSIITFELSKTKKGSVVYYIPTNFETIPLTDEELFNLSIEDAKNIYKFYEWVENINNVGNESYNNMIEEVNEINNPFE